MARRIIFAVTEEEDERDSTPRSRRVGARVPHPSIPPELQQLVGVVVAAARRPCPGASPLATRPAFQLGLPPSGLHGGAAAFHLLVNDYLFFKVHILRLINEARILEGIYCMLPLKGVWVSILFCP